MDRKPSGCHKLRLLEKYSHYHSQCNLISLKFKETRTPNCKERWVCWLMENPVVLSYAFELFFLNHIARQWHVDSIETPCKKHAFMSLNHVTAQGPRMLPKLKQIFIQKKWLQTFPDKFQNVYRNTKGHILVLSIYNFEENILTSTVSMYRHCTCTEQLRLITSSPNGFHSNHAEQRAPASFFACKNTEWLIKTCKC